MKDSLADGSTRAADRGDPPPETDGIEFPESFDLPSEFISEREMEIMIEPSAANRGVSPYDISREFSPQTDQGAQGNGSVLPGWRKHLDYRTIATGCVLLAAVEAGFIARLLTRPQPQPQPQPVQAPVVATVPVTINSPAPGDVVMVDGQQVGVTPFKLDVGASTHSISVAQPRATAGAGGAGGGHSRPQPKRKNGPRPRWQRPRRASGQADFG